MTTPQGEKCNGRMYLSRREPHPTMGPDREVHTFRCASCEHQQSQELGSGVSAAK